MSYDASHESYTVHVVLQGIGTMRQQLAAWSGVPVEKFKVVAKDVGGGFGQRSTAYPEYCAMMIATKALGRPVRWVSTRSESFLTDTHGRSNIINGKLALDADGRFLALKADTGERVWHFQTVHHDLWDYDIPTQPNLVTVVHDGRRIDAVAQVTKTGMTFLFERETGKPLFPIEERTVDVHIRRLRQAVERDDSQPRWILTLRGVGYKFDEKALES